MVSRVSHISLPSTYLTSTTQHIDCDADRWSDIYYVPRSVFEDWIFLAGVFEGLKVFHEIAVPTILQVIDDTRQTHPTRSLIEDLGDCWGNCCSSHPSKTDIRGHRCGHRLSFEDEDIWPTHFERLAESRQLLGQPWIRQTPIAAGGKKTGKKTDKKAGSEKSGGKKSRGWR